MAIVFDRQTKTISAMDTVTAQKEPSRYLVYHKSAPPAELVACLPQYRVCDGKTARPATAEERAEIDCKATAEQRAELIAGAQHIIDAPSTPLELAVWAAIQEVIDELRAVKSGELKFSRTDQELRDAAKQRLESLRTAKP